MTTDLKGNPTGTQFTIGGYTLRFAKALDADRKPTGEYCVWAWTGYYWALLVRDCTPDLESARYAASMFLATCNGSLSKALDTRSEW